MLYFRQNTAVRRKFFYLFRQPGSAFRFRLVVHGDGDPPFDGRQQMAVPGKKTDFFVWRTVLLHQGYGQVDFGKAVLSVQWDARTVVVKHFCNTYG